MQQYHSGLEIAFELKGIEANSHRVTNNVCSQSASVHTFMDVPPNFEPRIPAGELARARCGEAARCSVMDAEDKLRDRWEAFWNESAPTSTATSCSEPEGWRLRKK